MGFLQRTNRILRCHWAFVVLEVFFIVLSLIYSLSTGLWEGPDETGHFLFVRHIARTGRLPVQQFSQNNQTHEGHQPPLYYAIGALLTFWIQADDLQIMMRPNPSHLWTPGGSEPNIMLHTAAESFPYRGTALAIHIVRLLSIALGAVTVWATYAIGAEVWSNRYTVPVAASALVALTPQFLFLSGVVNNDNAVIACSALVTLILVRLLKHGPSRRAFLLLGLFVGLALLSKQTALFLGLPIAFVFAILAWKERSLGRLLTWMGWTGATIVIIAGWWYVRNQILYGDALAHRLFLTSRPNEVGTDFGSWAVVHDFLVRMHRSFWGMFGWMSIQLPSTTYAWLNGFYVAPVLGWLVGALWRSETGRVVSLKEHEFRRNLVVLFVLEIGMAWLWVICFSSRFGASGHQGRYLFVALPVIGLAIAGGVAHLLPERWQTLALVIAIVPLAILAVRAPLEYIKPAYPTLTLPESALGDIPHPLDGVLFGDLAELAGYAVEQPSAGEARLALYWRVVGVTDRSYKVFVHVLNSAGELCAQHDGFPSDWRFTTPHWRPGDVVLDPHPLSWAPGCCDGGCRVNAGFYLEDSGERLLTSTGSSLAEFVLPVWD